MDEYDRITSRAGDARDVSGGPVLRLVSVVGARPQFVKAAVVSQALAGYGGVENLTVHTGQHYDPGLSEVFFRELGLAAPVQCLGIGSLSHGSQTGRMLEAVEGALVRLRPHQVVVYGDTNSTLAGALAAAKLHIPVAHIEAGLRSYNRQMPEEINRVVTDHLASLLFAPTPLAVRNLEREGIAGSCVHLTGDVMYDASLQFRDRARSHSQILDVLRVERGEYLLATIHRAENTDAPGRLSAIVKALKVQSHSMPVVLPLHPRTRAALVSAGLIDQLAASVRLIEPVGYLDMVQLEANAKVIVTDSGGVQKEAFFYEVPCVTVRAETEWPETVQLGWNRLALPDTTTSLRDAIHRAAGSRGLPGVPYGDGTAGGRIAAVLAGCSIAAATMPAACSA